MELSTCGKHLGQYLNTNLKNIIDKVIQRKRYFGHPENLLIAMFEDDREIIEENQEF